MAGLGYDGSIRINTLINSDGFLKELNKMGGALEKQVKQSEKVLDGLTKKREKAQKALSEAFSKKGEIVARQNPLEEQLETMKKQLAELKKQALDYGEIAQKFSAPGAFQAKIEAEEKIKRLEPEIEKIVSEISKIGKEYDRVNDEIYKQQQAVKGYDSEIEKVTKTLEQQRAESEKISSSFDDKRQELERINQTAIVGNQHIVDLSQKLAELQNRQKGLSAAGLGLGYKEYDENTQKIAQITAELKKYQSELQKTSNEQNKLQGFLGTLDQIKASFSTLYNSVSPSLAKFGEGFANVAKTYKEALEEAFQEIGERLRSTEYFQGLKEAISDIGERISSSELGGKIVQSLSGAFDSAKSSIGDFIQKAGSGMSSAAGSFSGSLSEMGGAAMAFVGKINAAITVIKTVFDTIKSSVSAVSNKIKEIFGKVYSVIKPIAKKIADLMSKSFSAAQKGASTLGKGLSDATKGIINFARENNALTKLTDFLGSKLERLGRMVRRVFVFSVITKGLRALRSELASYLAINEQFSNSLRTLQGVLLTAFQPIYDAALPAIITLIDIVSKAIAVVSQFIAVLFGTTAKKAQQNAKTLYEQAHAVKAVGSAAKQAAKDAEVAIAAFDEFNILSFPDSSSGGGGGGGGGGIEMPNFDYEYEDFPFDSWGEAFSAFLDKLLDGLPKLEAAFKNFADWLNDLSKKLYDMFTFPGVLNKVKALGKGLAEALNKLVNWIDWNMLGKALGAGLNLALNFLTSFLYAFDWMNLGRKLAEFVNGLVSEIDWYEFGRLLWAGFKIALETLAGFIMGLDMPLMSQAASNIIKGFFDEMYNTIQRIPWEGIGKQIANFLNNIDWYGSITVALKAISAAIEALFRMVRGFIDELDWSGIASQIYQAINDSINLIDWFEIGRTISDAFIKIFDFLIEVISGIEWHEIGEKIADLILGFDFVGALSGLAMLIAESINAAVQVACGMLDKVEPELKRIASGIADGLKKAVEAVDWKKFGEVVGRAIKGALTFVAGLLEPSLFYAIGKAIGDFLVNLDWTGIVGGLAQVLANAIKSAVAAVQGFLDSVKPKLKEIAIGISEQINQFFRDVDWKEVGRTISDGLEAALDFLIVLIENINWLRVGDAIGKVLSNIDWGDIIGKVCRIIADSFAAKLLIEVEKAAGIIKTGVAIVEGILKGIKEAVVGIATTLYNLLIKPIIDALFGGFEVHSPSKVTEKLGIYIVEGLILGIKETWSGILEFFQDKINAIIEFFEGAWSGIKENSARAWKAVKDTIGGIWDSIIKKATEIFEAVVKAVKDAWEAIKKSTSDVWNAVKKVLEDAWKFLKDKAKEAFDFILKKVKDVWDGIKTKTEEIWNGLKTFLNTLWENLKKTVKDVFDNVLKTIKDTWDNVKKKTEEIWNNLKRTLEETWTNLKNAVIRIFGEIKKTIVDAWENIKREAIEKWNDIKRTISDKIGEIKRDVTEGFSRVKDAIVDKVKGAIDALKSMDWLSVGKSIVNGIANGLNGIFDKLKSWASRVWDTVSNAFNGGSSRSGSFGSSRTGSSRMASTYSISAAAADYGGASTYQLPKLANGAVIPPNQQFLAILGDQRSGVNIEAPLATIKQAVADTIREMGGMGGDIHITVESVLDGRVVARNTVKHINDMTTAAGKPVLLV